MNNTAFVTPGTIVIKKVTDPASDTTTAFSFTASGNVTPASFSLKNTATLTYVNVAPGTYTVTESALAGWTLTNLVCVDPSGNSAVDLGAGTATIQVAAGETVSCTFTNTQRGKIIVKKVTNPASDTTTVFGFTASGGLSPAAFSLKNGEAQTVADVTPNVPSGATYSVTESTIPGEWTLANATCDNGSSVADIKVNPGQTVTCTFTNAQGASIVIKKVTDPARDSTTAFGFTAPYIIIGAVAGPGTPAPYGGHTTQRVTISQQYPKPFALVGCSVTMHDSAAGDGLSTGPIATSASSPVSTSNPASILVADLHGADSELAGWKVDGMQRELRNVNASGSQIGLWITGASNTIVNGVVQGNSGIGILVAGDSNVLDSLDTMGNRGHGIHVTGKNNQIKKLDTGTT